LDVLDKRADLGYNSSSAGGTAANKVVSKHESCFDPEEKSMDSEANVVGWFVGYLEALFEDREVVVLAEYEREVECFLM
jgi:hypothetical protein